MRLRLLAPLLFLVPISGMAAAADVSLVSEIDGIVRQHFYAPGKLESLGWDGAVAQAQKASAASQDPQAAIAPLLATLGASHTAFYPRSDPAYWQMASIFQPVLARNCTADTRPPLPVTDEEIGVFWKHIGPSWFVAGLYAGGPADAGGIKAGDEVVGADGKPFSPVPAFAGKAGTPVRLEIRRDQGEATQNITVTPTTVQPHEALKQATEASFKVIAHGDKLIAYLHVWSWTSIEIQQVVLQSITKANKGGIDGFILDLRDGWGGASPGYLTIFSRDVPVLASVDRDGVKETYDAQIRVPAVILINGGTRSGKEVIAYGAKKFGFARLVGEPTAGAVLFGRPFCLHDGSLLSLAAMDAVIDGERLEGTGVTPDILVPFDIRYAAGKDPQLERAQQLLIGP